MDTRSYEKESYTSDQLDALFGRIVHLHLTKMEEEFKKLSKNKNEYEKINNPLYLIVSVELTDKISFVEEAEALSEKLKEYLIENREILYPEYSKEISLISAYSHALHSLIKLNHDLQILNEKRKEFLEKYNTLQQAYSEAEYQELQKIIDDIKKPISLAFDEKLRKETVKKLNEKLDEYETKITIFMQPKIVENTCIKLIELCQKYLEDREENKKFFKMIKKLLSSEDHKEILKEIKNNMPKQSFSFKFFPPTNIHKEIEYHLEIIEKSLDIKKTPIQQIPTSKKSSSQN